MKSRRILKRLAYVGVLAVLAAMIAQPASAVDTNNRADMIRGSGSDTTYGVMTELDQAYNASAGCFTEVLPGNAAVLSNSCVSDSRTVAITTENLDHDVATSMFPVGSSNGISQLCQRGLANVTLIDYARSSRAPRTTDCAGLRFVAFARDAIPWASFRTLPSAPSSAVLNLTQQQVKDIFVTCTITNWNQIGGANAPIIVYAAQAGSGTRSAFDGFVGGSSDSCIPAAFKDGNAANGERVIFENTATPIPTADRPNAIFYYSFGRFQVTGGEGSSLGSVDGVAPSAATIADGSFPYNRLLYNVYRNAFTSKNVSEATKDYIGENGWICKPNGQHSVNPSSTKNFGVEIEDILKAYGLVPLPEGPIGGGVSGTSKCRVTASPS